MTIKMAGVWKTFGEGHTAVHALKDVDLAGPQGEFTVILGPSGSGKTTLLNLVGAIDDNRRTYRSSRCGSRRARR